jgi:hypothetical protein
MKNPGMYIRHAKARGEWAELRFMTRATELGFIVTKPWGDMAPFDVALAYGALHLDAGEVAAVGVPTLLDVGGDDVGGDEVDLVGAVGGSIVVEVAAVDTWYILPVRVTQGHSDILLTPHNKNSKHHKYEEAWPLLKRR